jgi:hypothetical protein
MCMWDDILAIPETVWMQWRRLVRSRTMAGRRASGSKSL